MVVPELVDLHRWRMSLSKHERLRTPTFTETANGIESMWEALRQVAREERETREGSK